MAHSLPTYKPDEYESISSNSDNFSDNPSHGSKITLSEEEVK